MGTLKLTAGTGNFVKLNETRYPKDSMIADFNTAIDSMQLRSASTGELIGYTRKYSDVTDSTDTPFVSLDALKAFVDANFYSA